jgi:hypothetical protein
MNVITVLSIFTITLATCTKKEEPQKATEKAEQAEPISEPPKTTTKGKVVPEMTLAKFKSLNLSTDALNHAIYLGSDDTHHHVRYAKGFGKTKTIKLSRKELPLEGAFPLGGNKTPFLITDENDQVKILLLKK